MKKKFDELEKWSDIELQNFMEKRKNRDRIPHVIKQLEIIGEIIHLASDIKKYYYGDEIVDTRWSKEGYLLESLNSYKRGLEKDLEFFEKNSGLKNE